MKLSLSFFSRTIRILPILLFTFYGGIALNVSLSDILQSNACLFHSYSTLFRSYPHFEPPPKKTCQTRLKSYEEYSTVPILNINAIAKKDPELFSSCHAASLKRPVSNLKKEAPGIILSNSQGTILFSRNAKSSYIPASTIKVLTSLTALYYLGDKYHFQTRFYLKHAPPHGEHQPIPSNPHPPSPNYLHVQGGGDPLLTSEILADLCKRLASILRTHGVDTLDGIILDQSFFSSDITIDGVGHSSNPYDAPVGALSANFNSVFFKTDRKTNRPVTAEPETPLLPFVHQRINASGMRFGRIILNRDEGALYAGLLIKYFLKQDGIHVSENQNAIMATWKDTIITRNDHANGKNASVYSNDASRRNHKSGRLSTSHSEHVMDKIHLNENLIYTYTSPYDLKDIVQKLLKYSNNFIANQLFLTCGARSMGRPATIEKGITAGIAYAKKELGLDALRLEEGSGLSRKNRVSPMEMLKILVEFMPHHQLMSWQKNEGNSSKNLRDSEYGEFYKTGTLHGIRTRCGYFKTPRGLYPFVIMVNQQGKGYSKLKKTLWRRVIAAENRK